jgi:hypothetical protein
MAIKTIRVFAEYTSDGYVPMPSQGNIDYGITIGNSFPETQPSSYQTDDPNIDVAVNTMTDFYVWIRTHGSPWNPSYTRVVRVYPDSPSINSVVMNMIVAVGGGGTTISSGGGVNYYLNGGTSQGVLDGSTYYEMSKTPVEGAGVDFFKINTTGFQNIAQFVTDAGDPGLLNIPAGNWPIGFYFSASDNSGNPKFYAEIYKYSAAGVFTLLGTGSATPEVITNGTAIDFYTTNTVIPETTLLTTDRIAVRIFVNTDGNRTVNLHTQDSHLSTVGTTFTRGLTAINGLIKQVQYIAIGNAGSDAAIVSSDDTHTINLPTASATKRGLLNSTDWSTFNAKQAALSGTGFVKISGSTISYDNSTYQPLDGDLTAIGALAGTTGILKKTGANTWELDTTTYLSTGVAADTYQRKDKMVSNLLASDTEYPNSNAVLAKLALKADIANPQFTGSMNIKGAESRINFYDEADAIKYFIGYDSGFLRIYQSAGSASRFYINLDGKTFIPGIVEAGTIIKTGGTASQFLKADGTVDSNTYLTSYTETDTLASVTARGATTSTPITVTASEGREVKVYMASTYTTNDLVSGHEYGWYNDHWRLGMTRSGNAFGADFVIQWNGARRLSLTNGGNLTVTGTISATNLSGTNTGDQTLTSLGAQAKLDGTGFVKASGTTISYDNSTYLTTTSAASTYQRLDKMVSNLLASSTEYPNSNAVLAALALKANAANPTFTGDFTISGVTPRLYFVDTDNNPDYTVFTDSGYFYIYDQTAGATRFSINSSGNINSGVGKSITAGSFVKESGTASEYLMADGSVSTALSNVITGSLTSGYIPKATGANTIGNGIIYDNGSFIGISTTTDAGYRFDVNGSGRFTGKIYGNTGIQISGGSPYTSYTTDGLFGTTATPNFVSTSGNGGAYGNNALLLGYQDNESGLYSPAYGFQVKSTDGAGNINRLVKSIVLRDVDKNTQPFIIYNNGDVVSSSKGTFGLSVTSQDYRYDNNGYITYNVGNVSTRTFTIRNYSTSVLSFNSSNLATFANGVSLATNNAYQFPSGGYGWLGYALTESNGMSIALSSSTRPGGPFQMSFNSDNGFNFGNATNNTIWLNIKSNGNTIIGSTTDAGYKFDVNGNARFLNGVTSKGSAAYNGIFIADNTGTTGGGIYSIRQNGVSSGFISVRGSALGNTDRNMAFAAEPGLGHYFYVNDGTLSLSLNSSGSASFTGQLSTGALYPSYLSFYNAAAANKFIKLADDGSEIDAIGFSKSGSTATVWFPNGNVLIGMSTNAGYRLDINGFARATQLKVENSNNSILRLTNTNATSGKDWILQSYSDGYFYMGIDGQWNALTISNSSAATFRSSLTTGGSLIVNANTADSAFFRGSGEFDGSNRVYVTNNAYIHGRNNLVLTGRLDNSNDGYSFGTNCRNALVFNVNEGGSQGATGNPYYSFQLQGVTKGMYVQSKWGNDNSIGGFLFTSDNKLLIRTIVDNGYVFAVNGNANISSTITGQGGIKIIGGGAYSGGYTSDGLWGGTATPNYISTTGTGKFIFGYQDNGSGLYSGAYGFEVKSTDGANNQNRVVGALIMKDVDKNTNPFILYNNGTISTSGSVTATAFYESSDSRLKTLIKNDIDVEGIENLTAKLYIKDGREEYGYYAQEAQKYMPSAVTVNDKGYLNLSYREVHTAKIARLEKRVAELEKQLNVA